MHIEFLHSREIRQACVKFCKENAETIPSNESPLTSADKAAKSINKIRNVLAARAAGEEMP